MRAYRLLFLFVILLLVLSGTASAQEDAVELRMTWYNDGVEGDVMRTLLDRFEAENPGITVVMDVIPYADLHTTLQAQVEAGTPPDLARINDVARFAGQYLDLTSLVEDSAYWEASFPANVLNSLRVDEEDLGLYGFPLQFTITGPFINRTLFEQAGISVPSDTSDEVTWDEWIEAAQQVAEATETPYAIAIDRSGHRFWGFSLPLGAVYINEDGSFTIDTPGFRDAAQRLIDWHTQGITPPEVWGGSGGGYVAANEYFINAQVVIYYSGSWQISQFANLIGDTFDWEVVPNPTGPGGSTGIPGGSVLVGFNNTQHPEEVALLMDYLAQQDVLEEFSAETLFIPGHQALIEQGIEYPTNSDDLNTFLAEIPKISEQAYELQYNPLTFILNTEIRDRLSQVIAGELTLDQGIEAIQSTLDEAYAELQAAQS